MKKKKGDILESLTESIMSAVTSDHKEVKTIELKRGKELDSKSAPDVTHEADVYWEFEFNGHVYRYIILCRNSKTPVKKGAILELNQFVQDVKGIRPSGIYVSMNGFQRGAKKFAKANNLKLFTLREPGPEEAKDLVIEIIQLYPTIKDVCYDVEEDINTTTQGNPLEIDFYNGKGEVVRTMEEIVYDHLDCPLECFRIAPKFDEPTFINIPSIGTLEVKGVELEISVKEVKKKVVFKGSALVEFILQDVLEGKVSQIGFDKKPLPY